MKKQHAPFLVLGILIPLGSVIGIVSGNQDIMSMLVAGTTFLTAWVVAGISLTSHLVDGGSADDRFESMHSRIAIALLFFAIAESAAIITGSLYVLDAYQLAIGVVLLIGILLWVEGTLHYLYTANTVLYFSEKYLVIPLILVFSTLPYLGGLVYILLTGSIVCNYLLIVIPIEIALTAILVSQLIIGYHFRKGYLGIPVILSFIGTVLLLVRMIAWCFVIPQFSSPILQLTGAIAYWVIGLSLLLVKSGSERIRTIT